LAEIESYATEIRNWDFVPLFQFFGAMYLWTLLVAVMMYWSMAMAKGISPGQFLFLMDRTLLAIALWPVMFWRVQKLEVKQVARMAMRRLALAVSFFFTAAVPNFALAQSGKPDNQKKRDSEHTLVLETKSVEAPEKPKNSFALAFEGVDKYHGMAVGEIFAPKPAPRTLGRYTRTTSYGNVYVDSWNSMGRGFNNESDLGLGFEKSGLDVSYTHFFIRGGDIGQLSLAKSGSVKIRGKKVPLNSNLLRYFRLRETSPPTGTVFKLASAINQRVGPKLALQHRFALGVDNNPFGLGKGLSAIGFYTAELGFKSAYATWNATVPVAGTQNTSRGFRQSISVGYRHGFAW
jgi:hypothetical protein